MQFQGLPWLVILLISMAHIGHYLPAAKLGSNPGGVLLRPILGLRLPCGPGFSAVPVQSVCDYASGPAHRSYLP